MTAAAADWTPDPDEIASPVDATAEDELMDLGYEAAMPGLQCLYMTEAPYAPPPIR